MASLEREDSVGSVRRHRKHSSIDSGSSVPMWDSSDPHRAPPPLPLNPKVSPTKADQSSHVAAAAQALVERARESFNTYTINAREEKAIDKSPTRTPQHKRLQTLQTGSLSSLRGAFESHGSDWDGSRPGTPMTFLDDRSSPISLSRADTPSLLSSNRDMFKEATTPRSPTRPPLRSILSENTPPSATKLAIQNMPYRDADAPPRSVTTAPTPLPTSSSSLTLVPQNVDLIHFQIQNLISIAQGLQKEMAALSRRSKDNATDLISLKEATRSRDEDIRRSLRELMTTVRTADGSLLGLPSRLDTSRPGSPYTVSSRFFDDKPHLSLKFLGQSGNETASERTASPLPFSGDGTPNVVMLEKIIRDMATKEGQDRVLKTQSELLDKASKESSTSAKKFDELADMIKKESTSQALVKRQSSFGHEASCLDLNFESSIQSKGHSDAPSDIVVSQKFLEILQSIKDSVFQNGGLTAEVKLLVRELRGEVLGMGRELGRKLDDIELPQQNTMVRRDINTTNKDDLILVVEHGLAELKQQMDHVIQTRFQPSSSATVARSAADSAGIHEAVKEAIAAHYMAQPIPSQTSELNQEAILTAVREACEAYKPEIELQQFGLERDEILECLKEGLEDYRPSKSSSDEFSAKREDVIDAVQEALKFFKLPAATLETSELKEDILSTVRECLEDFATQSKHTHDSSLSSLTRNDVLDVIRQGFLLPENHAQKEVHLDPESLEQAVKAAMEAAQTPSSAYGDRILNAMQDIVDHLQTDLKQYTLSSGQDMEHVIATLNEKFDSLKGVVEDHANRSHVSVGNDEIMEMLRDGLENLRISIKSYVVEPTRDSGLSADTETTALLRAGFENLSDLITNLQPTANNIGPSEDFLSTLSERLEDMKQSLANREVVDAPDEILDAMKEEFEQLREAVLNGSAAHRDEILDAVQESLQNIQERATSQSTGDGSNLAVTELLKDEFDSLKATLAAPVLQYANAGDKEEILSKLQNFFDETRLQLAAVQTEASAESLRDIRTELIGLREKLESSIMRESQPANVELLEAIRDGLDGLRGVASRDEDQAETAEALDDVRDELEQLRESLATTLAKGGRADTDEILDAVRAGLEDLKNKIDERLPDMTSALAVTGDNSGVLSETLTELRADIAKVMEKPIEMDMTVPYEILDMLKDGLANVRADIERLRSERNSDMDGEVVLAEAKKQELGKMEVMLSHLQIKVEAMDQNIQSSVPAASAGLSEGMTSIESLLRDLQGSVTSLVDRQVTMESSRITKDDTDAIETLLENTKARLEESVIPTLSSAATKEQVDDIATSLKETNDAVQGVASRLEDDFSTRDDIAAIGALLQETTSSLTSMKDELCGPEGNRSVSKDDIDVIILSCATIKDKLDTLPASESVAQRTDMDDLKHLLEKLQKTQDLLKQRYEADIEVTAQAFDDRRSEFRTITDNMGDLKTLIEDSKEELKSRMKRGNQDVRALDEMLQSIEDKLDASPNAVPEVEEVKKIVESEFALVQKNLEEIRDGQDMKSTILLEKSDEVQAFVVTELANKLVDCFDELKTRQDEQRTTIDLTAENMQQVADTISEKNTQQEELLASSKAMVEDLKLTIDTLGASVAAISPALAEATEKMDEDAKTVFGKVGELSEKLDNTYIDSKTDHEITRTEVIKSLEAVSGLQREVVTFHPRLMEALTNIMGIAAEHFEHSKRQALNSSEFGSKMDEIKTSFAALPVPRLEAPPPLAPAIEKYDDSHVMTKLDQLLSHVNTSAPAKLDLSKIEEIHQQVMVTAAEVGAFVAFQNKMAIARHDSKEQEANETAMELNKLLTEKEELETKVVNLRETRQNLAADIESHIIERDGLTSQKVRLAAEVSSLETALRIRREELQMMDARADALERRIIEGVMDHSRALLLIKSSKGGPKMNLKRVASGSSQATASTATQSSVAAAGVNIALKSRPTGRKDTAVAKAGGRRIHSLGQITSNVPGGGMGSTSRARQRTGGLADLKRTQPNRNQLRKSTWAAGQTSTDSFDKENSLLSEESDEDGSREKLRGSEVQSTTSHSHSYSGTQVSRSQRASSYGTSGPSEYSSTTGSYMTGTESDRRSSYGSTIRSNIGIDRSRVDSIEYSEDDGEDEEVDVRGEGEEEIQGSSDWDEAEGGEGGEISGGDGQGEQQELERDKRLVLRGPAGSDSGLGSDLPTAVLSDAAAEGSYFRLLKGAEQRAGEHA